MQGLIFLINNFLELLLQLKSQVIRYNSHFHSYRKYLVELKVFNQVFKRVTVLLLFSEYSASFFLFLFLYWLLYWFKDNSPPRIMYHLNLVNRRIIYSNYLLISQPTGISLRIDLQDCLQLQVSTMGEDSQNHKGVKLAGHLDPFCRLSNF